MYTRKIIDFFLAKPQQPQPEPNAGLSPEAEFDWPPSAQDLDEFTVVHLRADDGSEIAAADIADVA